MFKQTKFLMVIGLLLLIGLINPGAMTADGPMTSPKDEEVTSPEPLVPDHKSFDKLVLIALCE